MYSSCWSSDVSFSTPILAFVLGITSILLLYLSHWLLLHVRLRWVYSPELCHRLLSLMKHAYVSALKSSLYQDVYEECDFSGSGTRSESELTISSCSHHFLYFPSWMMLGEMLLILGTGMNIDSNHSFGIWLFTYFFWGGWSNTLNHPITTNQK